MKLTMKVLKVSAINLVVLIVGLQLGLVVSSHYSAQSTFNYSYPGEHVTPEDKQEILRTLDILQQAYEERDLTKTDVYLGQILAKDDILILGTDPTEVFTGYREAKKLFESDWEYWGTVKFNFPQAHISTYQNTAYFVTRGKVIMDLGNLTVPLRVSGMLVKDNATWRIHKLQFQFDISLILVLFSFLISLVLVVNVAMMLVIFIVRRTTRAHHGGGEEKIPGKEPV